MCSYQVKQGNIFGRIGSGFGQGLAEQLPKEIEHQRLKSGLQELERDSPNLSPMQFATKAYGTYGISPQMVQSLGELARHQGIAEGFKGKAGNLDQQNNNVLPNPKKIIETVENNKAPTTESRESFDETLRPYIPPTFEEQQAMIGQKLAQDPKLYGNDPAKAAAAVQGEIKSKIDRSNALQTRRQNELGIQERIESGLKNQQSNLNAKLPGNLYSTIEDKAIKSVLPVEEGGEGLTEQQAKKKYGDELDSASRDYKQLETLGGWAVLSKNPKENLKSIRSLQSQFKNRNDLENFADSLSTHNGLSPSKAYYVAYPVSDTKALNNEIVKLPPLPKEKIPYSVTKQIKPETSIKKTLEFSPKLAEAMGKTGSPLAVYEELNARGYNGNAWMEYLNKNRDKLDLTERQGRELSKVRNDIPTMDDNWLFLFSGLDKLLEQ